MQALTGSLWDMTKRLAGAESRLPQWVTDLLKESFDSVVSTADLEIHVDRELISSSYLEFLRQQIRLAARGPEWNRVLEERLKALAPYVGQNVTTVTLWRGRGGFVLRMVDAPEPRLVQCEVQ